MKGKESISFVWLEVHCHIEKRKAGHDQELFSMADHFFTRNYFFLGSFPNY